MAMEPSLMLLDEPTSSLDPELVAEVLDVMRTMVLDGTTMIVVTHELGFALQVADRIIFMNEGRIVEQGPPRQILYNPRSERLKLFLSHVLHDGTPGQSGSGRLANGGTQASGEPTRSTKKE
jgi:ABC-type polar amino acid transport system ATPase subunit